MATEVTPILFKQSCQLKTVEKAIYALGHIHNDLCAAVWFSYGLIFFQIATRQNAILSGSLVLIGQIVDAAATPLAGYLMDSTSNRLGWHMIGSLTTLVSFPVMFTVCGFCGSMTIWQGLYYGVLVCLFQTGWALVQISHLSILPELSDNFVEKSNLTSYRYSGSMVANILVHIIVWIFLNQSPEEEVNVLGYDDLQTFLDISLVVDLIGAICSSTFHLFGLLSEHHQRYMSITRNTLSKASIKQLFSSPKLYKVAGLYTFSRLFLNLTMAYMPLYLTDVLFMKKGAVASVPLIMFVSAVITLIIFNYLTSTFHLEYKLGYCFGWMASVLGLLIIYFIKQEVGNMIGIFTAGSLFGIGSALMVVISLTLTVELVQPGGIDACIFSTVTFSDKVINGLSVFAIEYMKCEDKEQCPYYYYYIIVFVNLVIVTMSLIMICIIPTKNLYLNAERHT